VLKISEVEVEEERPLYPPKIIKIDVLNNPFDDIVPRSTPEERRILEEQRRRDMEKALAKSRPKPKKYNTNV
jgi:peptidyl-prolyl cis-trans isomerase SDCCAG10